MLSLPIFQNFVRNYEKKQTNQVKEYLQSKKDIDMGDQKVLKDCHRLEIEDT
jgi:hypothetical protein